MQRKTLVIFGLLFITIFLLSVSVGAAMPGDGKSSAAGDRAPKVDDRMDPLTMEQRELHAAAMEAKINGKAYGKTHEVARGQFVELEREGEGVLWTVLGEFADLQHNTMPEPDRAVDNTTIWAADFSRDYYLDMLFNEASRSELDA